MLPTIEELYEQYAQPLHSHIYYKYIHDADVAQDLVQEVFVRVCKSYATLQSEKYIAAWLYRIASNVAIDVIRHGQLITWQSIEGDVLLQHSLYAREEVEDGLVDIDVLKALDMLPPDYRQFALLREAGYSLSEIAEILDRAPGGMKMLSARTKKRFEEILGALQKEAA